MHDDSGPDRLLDQEVIIMIVTYPNR